MQQGIVLIGFTSMNAANMMMCRSSSGGAKAVGPIHRPGACCSPDVGRRVLGPPGGLAVLMQPVLDGQRQLHAARAAANHRDLRETAGFY